MDKELAPEIETLIFSTRGKIELVKNRLNQTYNDQINTLERALLAFESCVYQNSQLYNDEARIFLYSRLIFDNDLWGEFQDELQKNYREMLQILISLELVDANFVNSILHNKL